MGLNCWLPRPHQPENSIFVRMDFSQTLSPFIPHPLPYACLAHRFPPRLPQVIFRGAQFQGDSGHCSVATVTTRLVGKQWKEEEKKEGKGLSEEEGKPFT